MTIAYVETTNDERHKIEGVDVEEFMQSLSSQRWLVFDSPSRKTVLNTAFVVKVDFEER